MANYWQSLLAVRGVLYMSSVTSLVPNFREIEVRGQRHTGSTGRHVSKEAQDGVQCVGAASPDMPVGDNNGGNMCAQSLLSVCFQLVLYGDWQC
jgi:hypothetical protein